jgi:hypothetical protein
MRSVDADLSTVKLQARVTRCKSREYRVDGQRYLNLDGTFDGDHYHYCYFYKSASFVQILYNPVSLFYEILFMTSFRA